MTPEREVLYYPLNTEVPVFSKDTVRRGDRVDVNVILRPGRLYNPSEQVQLTLKIQEACNGCPLRRVCTGLKNFNFRLEADTGNTIMTAEATYTDTDICPFSMSLS